MMLKGSLDIKVFVSGAKHLNDWDVIIKFY